MLPKAGADGITSCSGLYLSCAERAVAFAAKKQCLHLVSPLQVLLRFKAYLRYQDIF